MLALLCACASFPSAIEPRTPIPRPHIAHLINVALSYSVPFAIEGIRGSRLFEDGTHFGDAESAIARQILRTNPRITGPQALCFAVTTANAARRYGISPEFLASTLLQESAYDPLAFSSGGAEGIAQFEPDTAAEMGIDPLVPDASIDAAAALLSHYQRSYRDAETPSYELALAAYNAGPGAVAAYHGIPPYDETREYIADITWRWMQILIHERRDIRSSRQKRAP